MLSNRSDLPLCQVSMFNTSPISSKCDITVRTCKPCGTLFHSRKLTETVYSSHTRYFSDQHTFHSPSRKEMSELHYPTLTKTILKCQYPGKPTLKVAFGSATAHFRKLLEVARFSFRDVTMAKDHRDKRNKLPSPPPPAEFQSRTQSLRLRCPADQKARRL